MLLRNVCKLYLIHGVTSLKVVLYMVTAVRSPNPITAAVNVDLQGKCRSSFLQCITLHSAASHYLCTVLIHPATVALVTTPLVHFDEVISFSTPSHDGTEFAGSSRLSGPISDYDVFPGRIKRPHSIKYPSNLFSYTCSLDIAVT
jgi:hypothetical protein